MGQDHSHPEPGDLIEIHRPLHQHWALYVGDGYVIHLTPVGKQELKLGVHEVPVFTRMVKKQHLKKVGNKKWRVNNESDQYHNPLPVKEIIRRAEGYIGKEVTYRVFGSNCEHFVKKLRCGDQRAFVRGEVHIRDMTYDKCMPKPGDLIEIKRGRSQHWALYVGNGCVIHVTAAGKAKVKKELLVEVAGDDDWEVSNKYDCHHTPLPVEEIIRRAESYVGKEVPYDDQDSNSEHFVRKLRYGGRLKALVGGELHIAFMTYDKCMPKPGDLIEIKRGGSQHWALYVGNGYVIHVTPAEKGNVKKELLVEVAGDDDWEVNNEYDCYCSPLPVKEIIWCAEACIGKEVPYDDQDSNSEHFVIKLRFGGLLRALVGGEEHLHPMTDDKDYPKPGDLIDIKRGIYRHWALYVGDGYVIHVTAADENAPPVSAGSVTLGTKRAKVKKDLLKEVAGNDDWDINNKYDRHRIPFPMEEIVWRAERWIDKEVPYRLFLNNCEHFVTMLRYGEGVSTQAWRALGIARSITTAAAGVGVASASALLPVSLPIVLAAGTSFGALLSTGGVISTIVHFHTCATFRRAPRDILEQRCC